MDAPNDPIVEALKKECQDHGLAVADPNSEDPIGTIFRVMLKDEIATRWVIVIYDSARRRVELQVVLLKEEKGQTHVEDEEAFAIFNLPSGRRLEQALCVMAHNVRSWLEFAEYSGDDGDDEEEDGDDGEGPDEDASDEEEEDGGPYPESEREPKLEDWFGTTD